MVSFPVAEIFQFLLSVSIKRQACCKLRYISFISILSNIRNNEAFLLSVLRSVVFKESCTSEIRSFSLNGLPIKTVCYCNMRK